MLGVSSIEGVAKLVEHDFATTPQLEIWAIKLTLQTKRKYPLEAIWSIQSRQPIFPLQKATWSPQWSTYLCLQGTSFGRVRSEALTGLGFKAYVFDTK